MFKKLLMTFVLVSVMAIAPNNLVYAQEETQDSGIQYDYVIHGPKGRVLYVDDWVTISPIGNVGLTLAVSGCRSYTLGKTYYNMLGFRVAAYSQKIDWCYNGSKITSVSHLHLPVVYDFLYKYNGIIGNSHSGGAGYSSYHAFSQASFCEYAPVIGCVWYFYPWVDQTVYGNGNYSGSTG